MRKAKVSPSITFHQSERHINEKILLRVEMKEPLRDRVWCVANDDACCCIEFCFLFASETIEEEDDFVAPFLLSAF
jgi:hypothetical protein